MKLFLYPGDQSGASLQRENKSDKTALMVYPILDKSYDYYVFQNI
jgi:hypothetical protein